MLHLIMLIHKAKRKKKVSKLYAYTTYFGKFLIHNVPFPDFLLVFLMH